MKAVSKYSNSYQGISAFCLSLETSKVASKKSGGMHNSKNHPLASSIVGGKNPGTSHMD
jgi:hypothetical protein